MIDTTVACCGLFCESCGVYIATKADDRAALEGIAQRMKTTSEEIRCLGCRSNTLSPHCRECNFKLCADAKGVANCEDCDSFPCPDLADFQKLLPHRAELFESAAYRKANGIRAWTSKMIEDYSCTECGTVNSPYYIKCKNCGNDPGNPFIARNRSLFEQKKLS